METNGTELYVFILAGLAIRLLEELNYRIALNFGGAKLWRISLHKNFEVLNFGETSTK